jgi:glycosyltransferase involved in cell wall biosynthesis
MRICMISYSHYESDNRVRRYAETLARRGDSVEVFAVRRRPDTPAEEIIEGVKVFTIQDRFTKGAPSKFGLLLPLIRFLFTSSWRVTRRHWREPYDVVHVHNIPDFLVFAAWYPKWSGATVLLDIHDIVPELFEGVFKTSSRAIWIRLLKGMERLSARFADHVIISNHLWFEKYAARSASKDKCSVFINNVDSRLFYPRPRTRREDGPIIIFPGSFQRHQGVDLAIHAFEKLHRRIPNAKLHLYGWGPMQPTLTALVKERGLDEHVRFFAPVPLDEIGGIMANADVGIVPKRADGFGNEAFSTKILEFMAVGVPVVVSGTKIDRYYYDDSMVKFFQPGDVDALTEAMYEVLMDHELRAGLILRASECAARNTWTAHESRYLNLIDTLRAGRSALKVAV